MANSTSEPKFARGGLIHEHGPELPLISGEGCEYLIPLHSPAMPARWEGDDN